MSDSAIGRREDQSAQNVTLPATLPILPISEAVIFPYMMVPLVLSDANLIKLADECLAGDKILGAFAQRPDSELLDVDHDDGDVVPVEGGESEQIYHVGTAVRIQKMLRFPDNVILAESLLLVMPPASILPPAVPAAWHPAQLMKKCPDWKQSPG